MKSWTLLLGVVALLMSPVAAAAPGLDGGAGVTWESFDDPDFDPSMASRSALGANEDGDGEWEPAHEYDGVSAQVPIKRPKIALGAVGMDAQGRRGRIHAVIGGDTLWDISEAYLGTPWVWPSIWDDNGGIANPHVINPGDRIWITATQMRRVTESEAESLIARKTEETELVDTGWDVEPEVLEPAPEGPKETQVGEFWEVPSQPEPVTVAVPLPRQMRGTGTSVRVSNRESMSFVTNDAMVAASSIVESPEERTWLAHGDRVYIGLGEGEVEIGDQFLIFHDYQAVQDPGSDFIIGYHVIVLGWAEVYAVDEETAIAEIRQSVGTIRRGDRVIPRRRPPMNVALRRAPPELEGSIIFLPDDRTVMGTSDYVYLNRGSIHGIEVGSELEVYEVGGSARDEVRGETVRTPDRVVATLVVTETQPGSAVAFVIHTRRELEVGDNFRSGLGAVAFR